MRPDRSKQIRMGQNISENFQRCPKTIFKSPFTDARCDAIASATRRLARLPGPFESSLACASPHDSRGPDHSIEARGRGQAPPRCEPHADSSSKHPKNAEPKQALVLAKSWDINAAHSA